MKLWKVLTCIDVGLILAAIACGVMAIWQDDPVIDEKLGNTIGVLVLIVVGLTCVASAFHTDEEG